MTINNKVIIVQLHFEILHLQYKSFVFFFHESNIILSNSTRNITRTNLKMIAKLHDPKVTIKNKLFNVRENCINIHQMNSTKHSKQSHINSYKNNFTSEIDKHV